MLHKHLEETKEITKLLEQLEQVCVFKQVFTSCSCVISKLCDISICVLGSMFVPWYQRNKLHSEKFLL